LTKQLGPPLIGLFAARAPLRYVQPTDVAPEKRKTRAITGIAEYVHLLGQDDGYVPTETHQEQQERKRRERKETFEAKLTERLKQYNPAEDPEVRGDPYKTLFVSRLAYSVTESDLRTVFEPYGAIDRIRLVNEKDTGKSRGYAFIVFEHERDMKTAYKETDGIKIKDRRICVDVERGRTVKNWKPRSLGGGLGGRHYTKPTRRIDTYSHAPSNYSRGPSGPAAGRYTSDRGTDRTGSSAPRGRSSDRNGRT
ncbi:U1 snRNP-associated protein Usp101, partial [Protomyces lactucae-debilis]